VFAILQQVCSAEGHVFWSEEVSILDMVRAEVILTHSQITDVYLLGLAVHYQGKLASLDRKISVTAVPGGEQAFELILGENRVHE